MLNIWGMDPSAASTLCWKVPYLENLVTQSAVSYSILSFTETWLKPHITDAQLSIEGFNIFRADRENRGRGGCCLYIRENMIVSDHSKYDDDYCQVIGCSLENVKTMVFSVYRPDNTPHKKFTDAINFIQSFIDTRDQTWNIVITGDFNFPNICWSTLDIKPDVNNGCKSCAETLMQFMESNLLNQVIDQPTRLASSGVENILDIVITNKTSLLLEAEVLPTLLSDHEIVSVILSNDLKIPTSQKTSKPETKLQHGTSSFGSLNFQKADFDKISDELGNVKWEKLKADHPDGDFPVVFYETVLSICCKYTPLKKISLSKRSKYHKVCYAINRKRRKVKRRIKAIQQLNPKSKSIDSLKSKLISLEVEAQEKIMTFKQNEEKRALEAMCNNSAYFYSYAKHKKVSKTRIGPLRNPEETTNNVFTDDSKNMADILQNQFVSVFSDPSNPDKKQPDTGLCYTNTLDDIIFNTSDLLKAIDEIKTHSSSGDDGFPAILLKKCKESLVYPLFMLWRESIDNGYIHPMFLHQLITPLYKGKGSRCQAVNYRPISLTSHIIKVFERVIRDKLVSFLEENNIISPNQHGFRKGRSCLSELLSHYEDILENANNGNGTDTVYLDFAKAFDKVDHHLLLKKLEAIGIKGKLLSWLKSFLYNRKQEVVVDGIKSFIAAVLSGVPQGSVLGPILFIIFINDIAKSLHTSKLKSFADDTKLSRSISCQSDSNLLQEDLSKVMEWSLENNMSLNESKFEFLKHNYNFDSNMMELPFTYFNSCYKTMNSTLIDCNQTSVKDLGVTFSSDSTFNTHIANIVKEAKNKASWILSVFKTRNKYDMMVFYKTYVRSLLEYCCPLWNPSGSNSITAIKLLEGVQRTFTSKIHSLQNLNYWQRLEHLHLMSLQRRRERYIIIYMWKILTGKAPNDLQIHFYMNQRNSIKATVPRLPSHRLNTALFDKSFSVLGPKLWNLLPRECTLTLHSLDKFKHQLGVFLEQFPDLPPCNGYFTSNSNSLLDWA